MSSNEIRLEEGWPASDDPTADSIAPPVAGGRAADGGAGEAFASPSEPAPSSDNTDKIARLDQHRAA